MLSSAFRDNWLCWQQRTWFINCRVVNWLTLLSFHFVDSSIARHTWILWTNKKKLQHQRRDKIEKYRTKCGNGNVALCVAFCAILFWLLSTALFVRLFLVLHLYRAGFFHIRNSTPAIQTIVIGWDRIKFTTPTPFSGS